MKLLPLEIKHEICLYLDFNKLIYIFPGICKYIYNSKIHMNNAIKYGNLKVIKFILSKNLDVLTTQLSDDIVYYGHLHVLKWLHKNNKEYYHKYTIYRAVENGHIDIVKWLYKTKNYKIEDNGIIYQAILSQNSNIETIKWLHENTEDFFHRRDGDVTDFALRYHTCCKKKTCNKHIEIKKFIDYLVDLDD